MITTDDRACLECETCETTHQESTTDKHAGDCIGPCGRCHCCWCGRCPVCGTVCLACHVTHLEAWAKGGQS